jgi:cytochrome c oxidase subunit 4
MHVARLSTYYKVFAALIVLALATTGIAFVDLGPFNTVVAMTIATIKAVLVIAFFMHVRYQGKLTAVFAVAGFCWLLVLLLLTASDYFTRGWMPAPTSLHPVVISQTTNGE